MATVLLVAALAIAALGWWRWWLASRPAQLRPLMRLSTDVGADKPLARVRNGNMLALSPDGTRLAFSFRDADGKNQLGVRRLHESSVLTVPGADNVMYPFFSPDGQWLAFFAEGKLKKYSLEGGATSSLQDIQSPRGASWGDNGDIVVGPVNDHLWRVPSAGGTPTALTTLKVGERSHRWPQVLPGSRAVLFTAEQGASGTFDDAVLEALILKTGERKTILRGGFNGYYVPTGHLIYLHGSTLFAVRMNLERLETTGSPVAILEDVNSEPASGGDFALSQTGAFVYLPGHASATGWHVSLMTPNGKSRQLPSTTGIFLTP